jgi:deoxyribonuclease V
MIACLDVHYQEPEAVAAGLWFRRWEDGASAAEAVLPIARVEPYRPGRFYLRELPCLLAVLEQGPPAETVVIDGYVWLGDERPGLGAHLYRALGGKVPVVGVAKTRFAGAQPHELLRGTSRTPLYVTAAGLDPAEAARHVAAMHGPFRIPTLLRRVDRLCRGLAISRAGGPTQAPA